MMNRVTILYALMHVYSTTHTRSDYQSVIIIPIIIDIDECSDGSSNCTTDSTCLNTQGSYSCICPEGYSGDGRRDGDGCRGMLW